MKNYLYLFPFNSKIEDVCDYAEQTIFLVKKKQDVLGLALSNPMSLLRDFKQILNKEFLVKKQGALILRPIMFFPFQRYELVKRLNMFINIFLLNIWFLFKKKKVVLWFFEPRYMKIFLRFLRKEKSIFDCVDYFISYKDWKREQIFCLKKSNFVFANSKTLKNKFKKYRKDIKLVPMGFAINDLSIKKSKRNKKIKTTFGFIGSMEERIDFNFLNKLLQERSQDDFIFIGPQSFSNQDRQSKKDFFELTSKKNVTWIDKLSRKKAWKYAEKFDVGLIPYRAENDFNFYSFPMKIMEYFYAGLPVVSTPIKELEFYKDFVYFPKKEGWLKMRNFLNTWSLKKEQQQRKIAMNHTWEKKISMIQDFLLV